LIFPQVDVSVISSNVFYLCYQEAESLKRRHTTAHELVSGRLPSIYDQIRYGSRVVTWFQLCCVMEAH